MLKVKSPMTMRLLRVGGTAGGSVVDEYLAAAYASCNVVDGMRVGAYRRNRTMSSATGFA